MTKVIYGLVDHEGVTRYVGQSGEAFSRLEYHISRSFRERKEDRTPAQQWVWDQIVVHRHVPGIDLLEFPEDAEANAAERRWIEHYGYEQLTNTSYAERLAKARPKLSAATLGRKDSAATKKRKSESAKRAWEKRRAADR
jgi:hypothetical protein